MKVTRRPPSLLDRGRVEAGSGLPLCAIRNGWNRSQSRLTSCQHYGVISHRLAPITLLSRMNDSFRLKLVLCIVYTCMVLSNSRHTKQCNDNAKTTCRDGSWRKKKKGIVYRIHVALCVNTIYSANIMVRNSIVDICGIKYPLASAVHTRV